MPKRIGQPQSFPGRVLFGTHRAAQYLGVTLAGLRHYIYRTDDRRLVPDARIGKHSRTLVFTRATLDALKLRMRRPGRPSADSAETDPA